MTAQHSWLKFIMGFQIKLLRFVVFLLLTLGFCHAKKVTVKIIGSIQCTDCLKHEFSNSQSSLGVDVFISCKSKNRDTETQGNSAIDKQGKFNVTLSAEITEDKNSIESCFAKLQTASSGAACPIQNAQTASVELLTTKENATQAAHNRRTIIKFSPVTCQSAFFWPHPNFTFFPTSPPLPEQPVDAPPPSEALPPMEDLIPPPAPASEPSYLPQVPSLPPTLSPPAPEIETPSPLPDLNFGTPPPTPTPVPTFQSPQNPPNPTIKNPSPPPFPPTAPPLNKPIPPATPKFQKPIPPPFPKQTLPKPPPYKPTPILPPIPPKKHEKSHSKTPVAPPTSVLSPPPPFSETPNPPPPLPEHEKPIPPPSPIGISTPPSERKPSTIPRAPPVPRLPPIPQIPRKYFNSPKSKSKSKPPHSI